MAHAGDHEDEPCAIGPFGIPLPGIIIEVKDGVHIPESILEEAKSDLE